MLALGVSGSVNNDNETCQALARAWEVLLHLGLIQLELSQSGCPGVLWCRGLAVLFLLSAAGVLGFKILCLLFPCGDDLGHG